MICVARRTGTPSASSRAGGFTRPRASRLTRARALLPGLFALTVVPACGNADQPATTNSSTTETRATAAYDADVTLAAGAVEALATDADPRTLYIVGNRYATGDGVPPDQDIAERLWRVACDKGHAFACSVYGSRLIEAGEFDAAAQALVRAGEAGVPEAIGNLIELYDNPTWSGASVDQSVRWQDALDALQSPAQSPVPESGD